MSGNAYSVTCAGTSISAEAIRGNAALDATATPAVPTVLKKSRRALTPSYNSSSMTELALRSVYVIQTQAEEQDEVRTELSTYSGHLHGRRGECRSSNNGRCED